MHLNSIGTVRSPLREPADAPCQGDEGAPEAFIDVDPRFVAALRGIEAGDRVLVLTWLDRADRDTLEVHPRGDLDRPALGVFATRSPDRPNPVGLHEVQVAAVKGTTLTVRDLEALDGTPVVDIKPVLAADPAKR